MKLGIAVSTYPSSFSYIVYNGGNMRSILQQICGLGYEGVDLFVGYLSEREIDELGDQYAQYHIEVANYLPMALSGTGGSFTDVDRGRRVSYVAGYKREMEMAARLDTQCMPVGFSRGPKAPDRSWRHYFDTLADSLMELWEYGEKLGITICLEPINRFEANTLNSTGECLAFLDEYDLSGVKLLLDIFHMNIEDASIEQSILDAGDKIGHFHAADTNRYGAGKGHADFDALIGALRQARYTGYLSMEAKALSDPYTCAKECASFLRPKMS